MRGYSLYCAYHFAYVTFIFQITFVTDFTSFSMLSNIMLWEQFTVSKIQLTLPAYEICTMKNVNYFIWTIQMKLWYQAACTYVIRAEIFVFKTSMNVSVFENWDLIMTTNVACLLNSETNWSFENKLKLQLTFLVWFRVLTVCLIFRS